MGVATKGLCLACAIGSLGCHEAGPVVASTVLDSLGVEIVDHGKLPDRTAFTIQELVYRVGWDEGDHNFERLFSGVFLSDGSAALGDLGASELVMLGLAGHLQAVLGGRGEAPGQIGALLSVSRLVGDTVLVEDDGNVRLDYFHDAAFVRSERVAKGTTALTTMAVGVTGRNLITTVSSYDPQFEEDWLQAPLILYGLEDQAWDTIGFYDFMERIPRDRQANPFRPQGFSAVSANSILVARSDRTQLRVIDPNSGATKRVIRWSETPGVLTDSTWTVYADWMKSRVPGGGTEQLLQQLRAERASVDRPLPVMSGIEGDEAGRVWVADFTADFQHPSRYRVFSGEGAWLGWVVMPPRFEVLNIGRDRILGIQRNEMNVDAAVVVRFR